jgi:hypothetical protein
MLVIPAPQCVIPAPGVVIPAQAGIHACASFRPPEDVMRLVDPGLRREYSGLGMTAARDDSPLEMTTHLT